MKPQMNKWATVIIAILFIALIIVPLVRNDIGMARNPQNYMTQGWQEATQYLRSQLTPQQEAEYTKIFKDGEKTDIPYVLAWWDYGYWIVRESHMPVISSPGGGARILGAQLLMSENPNEAASRLRELNIKYIVIDSQTVVEKFYSVVQYADLDLKTYYDTQDGELFKTADYYKTFLVRLYYLNVVDGVKLVFASSNEVLVWDEYMPEVKVFEVK